jgi:hypothetical protein
MQTDLDQLQLEFAKRSLRRIEESQQKVLALQEQEAANKTLAAFNESERTLAEKLASARTHKRLEAQAASILRPSNQMHPELRQVEDDWVATFGDVEGRGPTPETACQHFDRIWLGKDEL